MVNTIHVFDCFHIYILVKYIYSVDVLATDSFYIFWCQFDTLDWNRCERFDNSIISTGGDWILLRRERVPQFKFPTCWQKKTVFFAFQFISFLCWNNQFSISTVELRIFKRKTVTAYVWRNLFFIVYLFSFLFFAENSFP